MTSQQMSDQLPPHRRGWALKVTIIGWHLLLNSWHLMLNSGSLVRLVKMLRLEPFYEICHYNPRFALKFLGQNYLARSLDARAGLGCFMHHYQRMYSSYPSRILKMILYWDIPLYQKTEDEHLFSLDLGTSKPHDNEGELSLLLKVDSQIVFTLTFTMIPGWAIGSDSTETLLISRIQGERSCLREIRLATKAMCNVRPRALLVAALQGIALALGVEEIDAVSTKDQSSYCGRRESSFQNSYDEFFSELGLKKNGAGFFSGHVPIAEKPLELVDPNNRRTARKKQAFKAEIQLACAKSISQVSRQLSDDLESSAPSPSENQVLKVSTMKDEERS